MVEPNSNYYRIWTTPFKRRIVFIDHTLKLAKLDKPIIVDGDWNDLIHIDYLTSIKDIRKLKLNKIAKLDEKR